MLDSLTLKNFRKHTDAEFTFTEGLVVLRGSNEAGKTTLTEAIMYAWFGASALRESLDAVVTYDKPESSLKVDLKWHLDGVDYRVVRGKSGAELTYADQIVTGQRETRLFVERLFGCTADTAKLLMFADQNSIRGVLEQGGTAANGLVEKLARLGLIEDLVDRIQAQLPSGNTKAVDAQIETLKAATVTIPEEPSDSAVVAAKAEISAILEKIDLIESLRPHDQEVTKARVAVQAKNAATVEISRLDARKAEISATLAKPVTVPAFTLTDLEQARADAANSVEQARRWAASKVTFPVDPNRWEGDKASFDSYVAETERRIEALKDKISKDEKELAVAQMKFIKDKTCAFCMKDLTDVPEVAKVNAAAEQVCKDLTRSLDFSRSELKGVQNIRADLRQIQDTTAKIEKLAGTYWSLDYSQMPPIPRWQGAEAVEPGQSNLKAMEQEWAAYSAAQVKREMLQAELADMCYPVVPDTAWAEALIAKEAEVGAELQQLVIKKVQADSRLVSATAQYKAAVVARDSAIQQNATNAKALEQLTATRDAMHKHNELIKKLRGARPEIAAKMWGTVLGAVSRYFTQIRGEHSVVTRDADGFKVNGRSTEGLSGSTRDALGLAIRMALSKLFLPAVPLLVLDEGFAGADDNRELAGVSTLAGAGFSQVLLVTHSSLPETVADKLITL